MVDEGPDLFAGPGEMRERYRAMDWSATSFGPVPTWPLELQLMVRVCLSSGFPMSVHWGPDLAVLYNDAFIPLLGLEKHAWAPGRRTVEIWAEEWQLIGPMMAQVLQDAQAVGEQDQQFILERNGYPEECYFTFSYSPILDSTGKALGLFNTVTETTRQVLSERRLRVVRTMGAVSATQSGTTADTCRAMLQVLCGVRQTIPFAAAILRDEPSGRPVIVGAYGLADDAWSVGLGLEGFQPEAEVVARVMSTGRPENLVGLRERYSHILLPGPIGPTLPDEAMVVPLAVARGAEPVGALVVGVNPYRRLDDEYREYLTLVGLQLGVALTDSQAYESERQRVRVMADLDLVKMEFFQNVSHELRTPLTLLLAPLQDLLDPPQALGADQRERVEVALRAAERLRRIVNALLDFAQAEAGTLSPNRQLVDLGRVTAETASMFRSTTEHAGIALEVIVPPAPVPALIDPGMWSTIISNLVANAVKFTTDGGVAVRLTADGGEAVLTVSDTGIGIPPEERQRVFERFYRSSAGATRGGAGIGLALVADLVRAHDGRVDLTSVAGRGSTFTIALPLAPAGVAVPDTLDAAGEAGAGAAMQVAGELAGQPGGAAARPGADRPAVERPGVVLVEDDADLRDYLRRILTDDGWAVRTFADAESASAALLDDAETGRRDLVLTDVMLPGRSGLELIAELRANRGTARLPIIVLTARGGVEAAAEGMAVGADDYITKPFASHELLARARANHGLHQVRELAVDKAESRATQLRSALESNRMIGTATGILMARHRLSAEQGFAVLTRASQDSNRKLRDLAAEVVESGKLPLRPTDVDNLIIRVAGSKAS